MATRKRVNLPQPEPEPVEAGLADDYSEPDYTADESVEDETTPAEDAPVADDAVYAAYDPLEAAPSRFDPLDEEGATDLAGRPRLTDPEGNVLPEFDERWREDFNGLVFIGALSTTFTWLGHKISIRTITVDEALAIGNLTKAYADTMGAGLAYRTATAAVCVQRIDGEDLPIPLGPDNERNEAYYQDRFDYAKARWFQYTVDEIYTRYLDLEARTRAVVEAMGKASRQRGSTSG